MRFQEQDAPRATVPNAPPRTTRAPGDAVPASWDSRGTARLGALAYGALRCAVRSMDRESAAVAELRATLRVLCDEARADRVPPERLLILLKEVWRAAPETRNAAPEQREAALARAITLCIDEYYSPR